MRRNPLLLCLLMLLCLATTAPAQSFKVMPRDESDQDLSYQAFRDELLKAVRAKDMDFMLQHMDPDQVTGFGAVSMREYFDREKGVWEELERALVLGSVFTGDLDNPEFGAPYVTESRLPDDVDYFNTMVVIDKDVPLLENLAQDAKPLALLSYDLVTGTGSWDTGMFDGKEWIHVTAPDGTQGYMPLDKLYSPIGYRFYFKKIDKKWMLIGIYSGD